MKEFVNISLFAEQYRRHYKKYYEKGTPREYVEIFDVFLEKHPEFVGLFAKWRGDLISSDREGAAFMRALQDITGKLGISGDTVFAWVGGAE